MDKLGDATKNTPQIDINQPLRPLCAIVLTINLKQTSIMKVLKSLFLCVGTVLLALNFTACTDWGDADPEAGNQTYPDRSVVSTYTFDYGADDVYLGDIIDKADVCEAVEDADFGSNVLHLDANGYAVMANRRGR